MVVTEFYLTREDGVNLYRTYSDQQLVIEQETGARYDEAIDVENSGHTYTETDIPITPPDPEPVEDELVQAAKILFGEAE